MLLALVGVLTALHITSSQHPRDFVALVAISLPILWVGVNSPTDEPCTCAHRARSHEHQQADDAASRRCATRR